MKKRALSLLLASVLVISTFAACGSDKKEETPQSTDTTETATTEETTEGTAQETPTGSDTPLVVGYLNFSEKFSPFFAESVPDNDLMGMLNTSLVTTDREGSVIMNGAEGETIPYKGTDYTYHTAANITVTQNTDTTVYNFKLREDLVFSDGTPITADDIIFDLYVYADKTYDGYNTLNTLPIVGLKNYQANSTVADSIKDADVEKLIADMPEELQTKITETIIVPILTSEKDWCIANYESMDAASPEALYASAYIPDETYSIEGKEFDTIVADAIAVYGSDYKMLGANYGGDENYYAEDVLSLAKDSLIAEKVAAGEGEEVPNIEGIQKLGDYEVEVTTEGYDASAIYRFDIGIAPLHYYGDKTQYDYENNKFGFPREDLSIVKDKTTKPLGAGAYKFSKYENKIVYLEANESFFNGAPKIKNLQLKESDNADMIPGIQQGTLDLADPDGSKEAFNQIGSINGNGEIVGDKIITNTVDNPGYGYIGLNAKTMNVGGEPGSEESKNLRKAIATVMSVYRDVTVDSYYGDAASVINYPISNTSWVAPQKADADYQVAFSVDVEGNPIYTDGMSEEDRYAAALETALSYFEAAGYTVADGKITAAPAGAKTSYEVIVGAGGTGDHPSFAVLTDAKAALEKIGFTLEINDLADSSILWDRTSAKSQEIWVAAWQASPDPDMYQAYHSQSLASNHYSLADEELDAYILDARTSADQSYRKSIYRECLNIIMDWGVEIPVYQRQNCVTYSPERINADTFTPDVSTFYKWYREIQNIEMK